MTAQEGLEAAQKAETEARSKFRVAIKELDSARAAFNAAGERLSQATSSATSAEAEHEKAHYARVAAQRVVDLGVADLDGGEVLP